MITRYKTGKHFTVAITDTTLTVTRKQDQIDAEAALDGFCVLRTPVPAGELDAAAVVTAYKNLKYVERHFRQLKSDDLDLRPVFHRLGERVKAHVLICMLACYLTWHLRRAWAPLRFHRPGPASRRTTRSPPPGAPPPGPGQGLRPARCGRPPLPQLPRPARAPGHLLTRNQVRFAGPRATVPVLAEPTSTQREAFELIVGSDPGHPEVARTPTPPQPRNPRPAAEYLPKQAATSV